MSESLGLDVVAEMARICGLFVAAAAAALLAGRAKERNSMGAILDAIVGVVVLGNRRRKCVALRCRGKSCRQTARLPSAYLTVLVGVVPV